MVWKKIRNYLGTGLLVLLPAVITGYALWLVFHLTDGLLGAFLGRLLGRSIPGLGLLATLFLLFLAGLITTNYLGQRVLNWAEKMLARVPVFGSIYATTRQFTEALTAKEHGVFRRVVLVEYPRTGLYSLGFLTGQAPCSLKPGTEGLMNVFIPTVPNITTGFLIHLPADQLIYSDLSVDEGIKLIVSAGVVKPAETLRGSVPR